MRQFVRQSVLGFISAEKLGIEMPHRNLLVMERTYILIVISIGIVTALR